MDEKSIDPIKYPINKSSSLNQMRAILTTNGFIKIVFSDDLQLDIKENFLSKEASSANITIESKASAVSTKSKPITIDLKKGFQDDYDHCSEFKQSPRQVFMSTICHVRFLDLILSK